MKRIKLSDGTVWPRPEIEADDESLMWTLTYGTPTREDLLAATSVIGAYGYLLTSTTAVRRALIVREIRAFLEAEATR